MEERHKQRPIMYAATTKLDNDDDEEEENRAIMN